MSSEWCFIHPICQHVFYSYLLSFYCFFLISIYPSSNKTDIKFIFAQRQMQMALDLGLLFSWEANFLFVSLTNVHK